MKDIAGRNAQGFDAMTIEQSVTLCVPLGTITVAVNGPVDLDAQASLGAIEIDDIRAGRMLLSETESTGAEAELSPQQYFRECHLAAELARTFDGSFGFSQHCPSTMLRMVPLPKASLGRNESARPSSTEFGAVQ